MDVKKVLIIEGIVNTLIMSGKLMIGLTTQSVAIVGDAVHSLTDVFNNIVAFLMVKVAMTPPDRGHPYGHQKFERLAIFFLATLLTIVALELVINAIKRFGEPVEQSLSGLVTLVAILCLNVGLTFWERYWAKRLNSEVLVADTAHTLSDVLTTIVIIAGWQLAAHGYYWLDTVFAIMVSGVILYLSFRLFQRVIPVLVDNSAYDAEEIVNRVNKIGDVKKVRRVRSRNNGREKVADVIISVAPGLSTADAHSIANKVEAVLANEFNIQDTIVHVEPDWTN
ncbi:cation transporter [Candidatus Endobugula sertula]|uniref:Cation transporter n=1 Tax=Candidatus Endobugula sertula TaxID=62101 RepID=A0A1D2QTT4_9GAMM|nr:cation transporter [Candidatus Endobugula sertula]